MGRARNLVRRESQRPRTSTQVAEGSAQLITTPLPSQMNQNPAAGLGGSGGVNLVGSSPNSRSPPSSPSNQDGVGPSDFQSLSESIKSRFSAMSMRYKESITKSTRGWKERLFSRNNNNNSTEGRNEAGTDAPTVSHVISNGMDGNMTPDSAGHRQISAVDGNHSLTQGHRENPYTAGSVSD
ncbi:unnamed protein product [Cuscuta campestris]|uniref:Uncharacterized protein n=1 Tax=Cuscuta campestris TaxID=132261 RepID=A0A484NS37_9ASTE|nr:unnamed protein product [Cuscuta campestris]